MLCHRHSFGISFAMGLPSEKTTETQILFFEIYKDTQVGRLYIT